jgi:hypothetical protein
MDQWLAPDHLCFKVRVADRAFLLKYRQVLDVWEADLVRSGAMPPAGGEN